MPVSSCRRVLLAVMSGTASSWLFDFVAYFLARYKNEIHLVVRDVLVIHFFFVSVCRKLSSEFGISHARTHGCATLSVAPHALIRGTSLALLQSDGH